MNKLNLLASPFGQTGYNSHVQQLALALSKHLDVGIECNLPPEWPLLGDPWINMLQKNYQEETTLAIAQPWAWKTKLSDRPKHFIGYVVWEGDKIPKSWIQYLTHKQVDQIWVPSSHVRNAILNTTKDITADIITIPHGVNLDLFKPVKKEIKEELVFFANKGWRGGWDDRGGLQYVFKAFKEEFKLGEKVKCLIKLNKSYVPPNWDWKAEVKALGLPDDPYQAQIMLNDQNLRYDKLPGFYSEGDVFVCPSRSEAFGLTMLEGMAMGMPVITTDFGGQTDFVNKDNGWLIGGKLEEVKNDLLYEGIKWLTPDIKQLKDSMRYCVDNRDEVRKKSEKALEKAKEYSWDISAEKAIQALNKLWN